jgi:hypothetical protein
MVVEEKSVWTDTNSLCLVSCSCCGPVRSQIAVTDFDGDGKLDVLLGDFCTYLHVKQDLTPQQREQFDAIREKRDQTLKQLRDSMDQLRENYGNAMRGVPKRDWNTPENEEKWSKMYREMQESPAYKKLNEEYNQLEKDLKVFVDKGKSERGDPDVPHGFVWLFRRNK